jgi:tRNA modification GTPase
MDFAVDDTIAALASAPGPGPRAIVRVSGPDARAVVAKMFHPRDPGAWERARGPRRHPGELRLPRVRVPLATDVLFWPHERSYTGQPLAELHLVGSPPLVDAVIAALFAAGARPARSGEFTLRAFLAGRIDLLQAEAVLGVIDSGDEEQLRVSLSQLGGGLSQRIAAVHEQLLIDLADLEAGLDFVDEDIEFVQRPDLIRRLDEGRDLLAGLLAQAGARMQTKARPRVVLAGLPNAGKSTLFNALAGRDAALVSERAGTTRDYLSAPLRWRGREIELLDTAGWDDGADGPMRAAHELRDELLEHADLVLWCTAARLDAQEVAWDHARRRSLADRDRPLLVVLTKADLDASDPGEADVRVSALTGSGLDKLRGAVAARMGERDHAAGELLGSTAARCRDSLTLAAAALARGRDLAAAGAGEELISVELREGIDHLGRIAGRVYTDDVLDRIFSRFCIGK